VITHVPPEAVATGRATPGATTAGGGTQPPLLDIRSSPTPPADAFVSVPYDGQWFWIANNDVHSKGVFSAVILLFSISDVGVRTPPAVVTVPAN
jgi:hypothetical protein